MSEIKEDAKTAIDWGLEIRYAMLGVILFVIVLPLVMEADTFPIDSWRKVVHLALSYFFIWNGLVLWIPFTAPFLMILPLISGPIGARMFGGWRGAIPFAMLGTALNILWTMQLP
jgi:hypothetical protein